jgi:hypothetical protein
MKLVVVALFALWPGVFKIGEWLLSWLGDGDIAQVVLQVFLYCYQLPANSWLSVMGLFPIIMNILQFWLIDSIVKASGQSDSLALPESGTSQDREPLFRASESDDEDDDTIGRPKYDIENPPPQSESRDIDSSLLAGKLAPDTKSVSATSGSTTPMEVGDDDVILHRYKSTSPTATTRKPAPPSAATDEWAWDDPVGQGWEDDNTAWRGTYDEQTVASTGDNQVGQPSSKAV